MLIGISIIIIQRMRMKKITLKWTKGSLLLSLVMFAWGLQAQDKNYTETGLASFYADKFEGRKTANGEIYYHIRKTAAHPHLPFGSVVKVTNPDNNKFVVVRINDRGPFVPNRIIDLSKSAARELGFVEKGLAKVRVELIASTDDLPGGDAKQTKVKTEYYGLDVKKVSPTGTGVQMGSFSSNDNVFQLAERLKKTYNNPVYIQVVERKQQKFYRVIVGQFSSENEAESLKNKIAKEFPDCFVVTFK